MAQILALLFSASPIFSGFPPNVATAFWFFLGMSLFLSFILYQKFHWSIGFGYAYFSVVSIPRFIFEQYFWQGYDLGTLVGFAECVAVGFAWVTVITMAFFFMQEKHLRFLEKFLLSVAFIDMVILSIKIIRGKDPFFVLNNAAIDVSFMACLLPLAWKKTKWWALLFIFPCIFTKTSSGILGAGVFLGFLILEYSKFWAVMIAALVANIGYWMQGDILFHSSGRYDIWKMMWAFTKNTHSYWFGKGVGTFYMYGPAIQMNNYKEIPEVMAGFFWMHNEWLQIVFETGFFGLIFASLIYFLALHKSRKEAYIWQSLILFGLLSVIQPTLRHGVFSAVLCLFITRAFRAAPEEKHQYNDQKNPYSGQNQHTKSLKF